MHPELVVAKLVTVGLGLLIAYQAHRGYNANGSRPMLYVAMGFVFISVGAVIEAVLFDVVKLSIYLAGTIQTALVALGMLMILYSLYGVPTRGSDGSDDHV